MLNKILDVKEVTVIDKKSQQAIQGGGWTEYLWCLRTGGHNCNAHMH